MRHLMMSVLKLHFTKTYVETTKQKYIKSHAKTEPCNNTRQNEEAIWCSVAQSTNLQPTCGALLKRPATPEAMNWPSVIRAT